MSRYSIKDMELLSNVKAHTIRMWEQRYNLFTPERTETNIRYYTDQQLKHLLNVCTLMNLGMKISHISKLGAGEISGEIEKLIASSKQHAGFSEAAINQLLAAVSCYDQEKFEEAFSDAMKLYSLTDVYVKIIYPLLVRTGLMWAKDDLMPAQEHFLSNLVKQKLNAAIDKLPPRAKADQTWLLFLPEGEKHEIGLLFGSYLIRLYGKRVFYLGQEVPYDNLSDVIAQVKPTHLYTFFVRNQPAEHIAKYLTALASDFPSLTSCHSSAQMLNLPINNKIVRIQSVESLINLIK